MEKVLEGEILPDHREPEGPYGEVPGTYAKAGTAEIFRLKAITRRRNAIYYALHCGAPVTCTQATTGLGIEIATWEHLAKVEGGLDLLDRSYRAWTDGVRSLGDDGLRRPCGPAEGPFADYPMAALVLHISREVIHHGSELCLMRDLYRTMGAGS